MYLSIGGRNFQLKLIFKQMQPETEDSDCTTVIHSTTKQQNQWGVWFSTECRNEQVTSKNNANSAQKEKRLRDRQNHGHHQVLP